MLEVEKEKQALSQLTDIQDLNQRVAVLENEKQQLIESSKKEIIEAQRITSITSEQITSLSNEIDILKNEINILNSALEASEQNVLTKELKIDVLGERLNKALTSKVFELQKYRSEFFGRLQALLGEREDIKIVGDRFIFESELLFDSGSATLQSQGKTKLKQIGLTLKETTMNIPEDKKLNNGNYLITTVGSSDGGHILEITTSKEIAWNCKLNVGTPQGAIYRSMRISNLYESDINNSCTNTLGDLNNDENYDIIDIVALANCVLASNCTEFDNGCASDINNDGNWDVVDIVALANCVLASNC